PLVAAPAVPDRDQALVVAAPRPHLLGEERLVRAVGRQVRELHHRLEPAPRRGWLEGLDSHRLDSLEQLDRLLAGLELHVGLLPVRTPADSPADGLRLSMDADRPHRLDLALEDRLHGLLDLDLVRV